jgi:apolipoprotein N-acyltransferase
LAEVAVIGKVMSFMRRHPFWACAVLAALSAVALPPVNAWPVLFITVPTLILLIEGEVKASLPRRAALGISLLHSIGSPLHFLSMWRAISG